MNKIIDRKKWISSMHWSALLLVAISLAIAPGYASAQNSGVKDVSPCSQLTGIQEKVAPTSSPESYTLAQKEAYERNVSLHLDEMQQNIGQLRMQSRTVVPQKKEMVIRASINLQSMVYTARLRLEALKTAPEQDWGKLKVNMDKAMTNLNTAYQEIAAQL